MNASELRIGNRVDKGVVKSFYENEVHIGGEKCFGFSELNPVPLTEQILIDFGMCRDFLTPTYRNNTRLSVFIGNGGFFFAQIDNVVIRDIYFIHELQNLYFSITNQEL